MKLFRQNENGITLVELLAVILISSILVVLIMSIFMTGHKQHDGQRINAEQLNDVRYAAKVITKEIRKAEKIIVNPSTLITGSDSPAVFKLQNNEIQKNGQVLVPNISNFNVDVIDRSLVITFESTEQQGKSQKLETQIYIREGVVLEEQ